MWVFSNKNFLSVVQNKYNSDQLLVRARFISDMEYFVTKSECGKDYYVDRTADYPYRIMVDRAVFEKYLVFAAKNIDYKNFKDSIDTPVHQYKDACMKVWGAMFQAQLEVENYFHKTTGYFKKKRNAAQAAYDRLFGAKYEKNSFDEEVNGNTKYTRNQKHRIDYLEEYREGNQISEHWYDDGEEVILDSCYCTDCNKNIDNKCNCINDCANCERVSV